MSPRFTFISVHQLKGANHRLRSAFDATNLTQDISAYSDYSSSPKVAETVYRSMPANFLFMKFMS